MDHNLLAILEETEDSDYEYDYNFPTVVSGLSDIQTRGELVNQARVPFKDKIFKARPTGHGSESMAAARIMEAEEGADDWHYQYSGFQRRRGTRRGEELDEEAWTLEKEGGASV